MKSLARAYLKLTRYINNSDNVAKALWEIQTETVRQSNLVSRKLSQLVALDHARAAQQQEQTRILLEFLKAYAQKNAIPFDTSGFNIPEITLDAGDIHDAHDEAPVDYAAFQKPPVSGKSYEVTFGKMPLMLDEKTFNIFHPHFDPKEARCFSGKIFNMDKPCDNKVYKELKRLAKGDHIADAVWKPIRAEMMAEVKLLPAWKQVAERKAYVEDYILDISRKYGAFYAPGWVTVDDGLFLYWLVRKLNPKTIVQTGVCNGLSSAFMMMALDKNNAGGKLHVIDMPAVFNPKDPVWTKKDAVYGVVIPEGKTSGWIVPDAYHANFEVISGDAKIHLPKLIERLPSVDMFYHDSDHTYDHMMFEFTEAKKKLTSGGLMVGDDISWNASLWDFDDQYGVPGYNYKTTVGVGFF